MDAQATYVSADSHVAEVDASFEDIDPRYRDRRPRAIYDETRGGAIFQVEQMGLDVPVPMGLICTAGRAPELFGKPVSRHSSVTLKGRHSR